MRLGLGMGLSRGRGGATPVDPPTVTDAEIAAGTYVVGDTMTATYTLGGGTPDTITRTWYRGVTVIFTSTSSDDYVLEQDDAGNTSNISFNVAVENVSGSDNDTSNTIAQIFDADAEDAVDVGDITGSRQQAALNQLAINLKGEGQTNTGSPLNVWNYLVFLPPYSPKDDTTSDATSFAVNLIDRTRNLTFVGFVSGDFSINGLTGGAGKYALTGYTPSGDFDQNNSGLDGYSRTQSTNNGCAMGCSDASYANGFYLYIRNAGNQGFSRMNDSTDLSPTITDSRGMFSTGRTASNAKNFRQNGVVVGSAATVSTALSTREIVLHAINRGGTITEFDNRQFAGFVGREGLSQPLMDYIYECWQIYQSECTPLGREV